MEIINRWEDEEGDRRVKRWKERQNKLIVELDDPTIKLSELETVHFNIFIFDSVWF